MASAIYSSSPPTHSRPPKVPISIVDMLSTEGDQKFFPGQIIGRVFLKLSKRDSNDIKVVKLHLHIRLLTLKVFFLFTRYIHANFFFFFFTKEEGGEGTKIYGSPWYEVLFGSYLT